MLEKSVILLAPPGGGKDTVVRGLNNVAGASFCSYSMSQTMRDMDPIFPEWDIQRKIESGAMVEDCIADIAFRMQLCDARNMSGHPNVIFNGAGRTPPQFGHQLKLLSDASKSVDIVFIDVSDAVSLIRQRSRAEQDSRPDSSSDPQNRLRLYREAEPKLKKLANTFSTKAPHIFRVHNLESAEESKEELISRVMRVLFFHAVAY